MTRQFFVLRTRTPIPTPMPIFLGRAFFGPKKCWNVDPKKVLKVKTNKRWLCLESLASEHQRSTPTPTTFEILRRKCSTENFFRFSSLFRCYKFRPRFDRYLPENKESSEKFRWPKMRSRSPKTFNWFRDVPIGVSASSPSSDACSSSSRKSRKYPGTQRTCKFFVSFSWDNVFCWTSLLLSSTRLLLSAVTNRLLRLHAVPSINQISYWENTLGKCGKCWVELNL